MQCVNEIINSLIHCLDIQKDVSDKTLERLKWTEGRLFDNAGMNVV